MGGRQTKRQRRAAGIQHAREVYTDAELGIRADLDRQGRLKVQWHPGRDETVGLISLERLRGFLDAVEAELVLSLREQGLSWDELGWCLGQSGEAVRRRHWSADLAVSSAGGGDE